MKNIGFSSESVNVAVEMKKKAAEAKQKKSKPGKGFPKFITGAPAPIVNDAPKHRQNDPCPCGSGKKFKKCHGRKPMEGGL